MSSDSTERIGVNAIEGIFLNEFGWIFREQPISDYGIDAIVEIKDGDRPTGKLIALQIKTGKSYFKKRRGSYVFNGEMRHLDYWGLHSLPVFLILYNPDEKVAIWQKIERRLAVIHENGWSISIPVSNILDKSAKRFIGEGISADEASQRRFYFSIDAETIKLFFEKDEIFFKVQEWVNKSLNLRGIDVYFDDYRKEDPDMAFNWWSAGYSVHEMMQRRFPWLTYDYAEPIENHAGEVDEHVLAVQLCEEAEMFLKLETFYAVGPTYEMPDDGHEELSEEEQVNEWIERAIENDRS